MKLVTGNDLGTGDVIWWTGCDWSRHVADAVDAGEHADAVAKTEEAARRVNVAYVVDAAPGTSGPTPLHIKERIRASGPTVRPDLGVQAADSSAGSYVI